MTQLHPAARSAVSLSPREHGAYGQLLAPLASALLGRPATVTGLCFAVSFVSAFFAHEPWLVLTGQRGARAERALAGPAKRRLVLLLGVALTLGIAGIVLANQVTRLALLAVGMTALLTILLGKLDRLHNAVGEVWAGVALASLSIPVSLASSVALVPAIAIAMAWALAFASGVFAVRAVIARKKTGARGNGLWGLLAALLLLIVELRWAMGPVIAVLPLTLASVTVFGLAPSPRHLRKIGWTLVSFTVLAALLMVLTARASWFQA